MVRPVTDVPLLDPNQAGLLDGFQRLRELRENRLGFLLDLARDERPIVRQRTFGWQVVLPLDPALLSAVLVDEARAFEKSPVLRISLHPLAGLGLFTSEGELWKRQRRLMAPLFQPAQMRLWADQMTGCTLRAVDELPSAGVIDAARLTTRITMAVAGATLFDADTFGEADALGEALTVALDWTSFSATSAQTLAQARLKIALDDAAPRLPERLRPLARDASHRLLRPLLLPTKRNAALRHALGVLEKQVDRMIAERRAADAGGAARADLLSRLLAARDDESGHAMTDRQVRDEVLTLFVAGHETTATALAWALHELVRDPALLARARAEADAVGRTPTLEDAPRLALASRIFKESLRKYPPVFMFGRVAIEPVVIGDWALDAGTVVLVSPFAVHRRASLYPDPERFDPDRFLPEAEAARPRTAFLPFSWGPRTCIGNHFALLEGPLVLATLLRELALEDASSGPIQPDPSATLRPEGGVPVRVSRRRAGASPVA